MILAKVKRGAVADSSSLEDEFHFGYVVLEISVERMGKSMITAIHPPGILCVNSASLKVNI